MSIGRFHGDLPERTYQFARVIVRLVRSMQAGTEGWTIGRQLLKCGTSIGANVHEADAALADPEFVSCANTARREARETQFWLRLCRDEQVLAAADSHSALCEAEELGRILTTIVRKSRGE